MRHAILITALAAGCAAETTPVSNLEIDDTPERYLVSTAGEARDVVYMYGEQLCERTERAGVGHGEMVRFVDNVRHVCEYNKLVWGLR